MAAPMAALRRRLAWIPVWLAVAAPFALYALEIPRFGELQRNDYWGDFAPLVDANDELTRSPLRWLQVRSNEHRIMLPLLLWTSNIELTRGDNRALSALSLLLLVGTFACLWRLLPEAVRGSPLSGLLFGLPLAALIATPVAAHCWVMGFSGNQWYFANLSAAAAIACFARLRPDGGWRPLLFAALATLPGAFAHSTHLAIWPALLLGALLVPVPRRTAWLCAGMTAAFFVFFSWGYAVPPGHPTPGGQPASLAGFVTAYLSLRASTDPVRAQIWGAAGLVLFFLALAVVVRRPRERRAALVPILLVACYGLVNGVGTSIGRVGFGLPMAFSSRYASLPSLFWLGTLGTLAVAARQLDDRRRRGFALSAIGLATAALLWVTSQSGLRLLAEHLESAERQPLAALAMRWQVRDVAALRQVSFGPHATQRPARFFAKRGHRPYDRAGEWPLGRPWPRPLATGATAEGVWQTTRPLAARFFLVTGSIARPAGAGERIVFLDGAGTMRGGGVFIPREGAPLPPLLGRRAPGRHWEGYLDTSCHAGLRAFLETGELGERKLAPLETSPGAARAAAARCPAG